MIKETMTIHEALTTLKTLDKRVLSRINSASFCIVNKHCNEKINGKSITDVKDDMRSGYESIVDLIARRAAIRNALSISNAETTVTINGREYTVAEAIEMKKTGMALKRELLSQMSQQFTRAKMQIDNMNGDTLLKNADTYVSTMYGNKDKVDSDTINAARNAWIKANTLDLIDPLDVSVEIKKLEDEIDKFSSEVDSKISVSNALTTIEVEY